MSEVTPTPPTGPPLKVVNALVFFSDMSGWSKQDAVRQHEAMRWLNEVGGKHLRPVWDRHLWSSSTGDGFAVALNLETQPGEGDHYQRCMSALRGLYEETTESSRYLVRCGAAEGLIGLYHNTLIGREDVCGPAVITARRLVDATAFGWFLVEKHLADNLERTDGTEWVFGIPQQHRDKHGQQLDARRLIAGRDRPTAEPPANTPTAARGRTFVARLRDLARRHGVTPSEEITATARRMEAQGEGELPLGIGGVLLLWVDASHAGLAPDLVQVQPRWKPEKLPKIGVPPTLEPLPGDVVSAVKGVRSSLPIQNIPEDSNRPKVWLREMTPPLTDRPLLTIRVGGSDYRMAKALERAHQSDAATEGGVGWLRQLFETGRWSIEDHLFGMIVPSLVMVTADDYLVFAKRGKKTVDFAGGAFSPSCEEQWDPAQETRPHQTVLRCLEEEWNLDAEQGVEVSERDIKLVAIGREWGLFWNTVFIYVVHLPCSGEKVLECWDSVPPDKAEAAGVMIVSMRTDAERQVLLQVAKSGRVSPGELQQTNRAKWIGKVTEDVIHPTTGAVRILAALARPGWHPTAG